MQLDSARRDGIDGIAAEDVYETIERALVVLIRGSTRGRELLTDRGLARVTFPAYALLTQLLRRDEPATVTELARCLGLDKSTTSRQVAALERDGLIERVRTPADGRAVLIRLSPDGRRALTEEVTSRRAALRDLLSGWPHRDRAELARLLGTLTADLGLPGSAPFPSATPDR